MQEQQQTFEIQNVASYVHKMDQLENFLRNVNVQIPSINRRQVFNLLASQLEKSFSVHRIKGINLWVQFVKRLDHQNYGLTSIHMVLLRLMVRNNLYKLALKLISVPRLPTSISTLNYRHYLLLSSSVYHQYQKYQDALECLHLAKIIQDKHLQQSLLILQLLVLMNKIIGHQFLKRDFIIDIDRIKLCCKRQIEEWIQNKPQRIGQLEFEIELFTNICQNKQLRPQEISCLQKKQLLDLYNIIPKKEMKQLKTYVKSEIYNPLLYRIKCLEIKDHPIMSFQTIKQLNNPIPIYKYDLKNSLMYFQHYKMTQKQLDQQIDLICILQQTLKKKGSIGENRNIDPFENRMDDMRDPAYQYNESRKGLGNSFGGFFGFMNKR